MNTPYNINFATTDKSKWLYQISTEVERFCRFPLPAACIAITFNGLNALDKITPTHIVSLACLTEALSQCNYKILLQAEDDNPVSGFLWKILQFEKYWNNKQNYVQARDSNIFNLWRIVDEEKEVHSRRIHDYLKQHFFQNKDLSAVQNSLDEAYYNIFDHAEAHGNAFSLIKYDKTSEKLYVAVCDFGIGIARSVRNNLPRIASDADALCKAMEYNFTTGSQAHNKGMGLGNIKDTCTEEDILGIISNRGVLLAKQDNIRAYENHYSFPGTLIYFELSLSHFEDEEIFDNFVL